MGPVGSSGHVSVTSERIYKTEAREWKSSHAYTRDDLLTLAKQADWANAWIATEGREASGG